MCALWRPLLDIESNLYAIAVLAPLCIEPSNPSSETGLLAVQ
jgi:hypothetical protein